ncbi:spore photoproduct lyase [Desulfosporosinus meridiei]|uniref:Spore photoproduct lyase n=1 Tax=Desulfosporosinus meridiei (strain ATCC BAA-275 / DSM 13257 / KCTC 12902 / NCIMB 13706 / S10) TaxID=768704 RepID=J7IWK9_DESMD|nr:spore photoproduct lyase [Desulfosporosinus meridiei]AFQ43498.1 spore photoproduct lyase [Desulfosporosinus meridiei DSM 13257]
MSLEFRPTRVFYEPSALDYPLGKSLVEQFRSQGVPIKPTSSHNRITGIPGDTPAAQYGEAKRTLVIGVRRSEKFQSCKPSAHYQLPLVTSCPGMCEYCYLATTLGKKPYIRVYVNLEEILDIAAKLIEERLPEITQFEGAATSDPVPVERYTGSLKRAIEFFGRETNGRFRFVTKYTDIQSLLDAKHEGHTRFRFSLNCDEVVEKYEHGTPAPEQRIIAAGKVLKADYPLGFIIAPIFRFPGWQEAYQKLMERSAEELVKRAPSGWSAQQLSLEFISHRFTARAKTNILDIFPKSSLPMNEEERKFKYGQFGYGKYLYQPEEMIEMKEFFLEQVKNYFPLAQVEYFV